MGKSPFPGLAGGTAGARVTKRGHSAGKPSPSLAGGSKAFKVARKPHSAGKPFTGLAGGTAGRRQKGLGQQIGKARGGR